jgi:hypothetical protein
MKINITDKKIPQPFHLNCYKVAIRFMFGDADGYSTTDLFIPRNEKNDAELPRFLQFLENCENEFPHGRGGYDYYDGVEDYNRYVEGDDPPPDAPVDFGFYWEWDAPCDCQASFDSYKITFFDENSVEYFVEVTSPQQNTTLTKPKI